MRNDKSKEEVKTMMLNAWTTPEDIQYESCEYISRNPNRTIGVTYAEIYNNTDNVMYLCEDAKEYVTERLATCAAVLSGNIDNTEEYIYEMEKNSMIDKILIRENMCERLKGDICDEIKPVLAHYIENVLPREYNDKFALGMLPQMIKEHLIYEDARLAINSEEYVELNTSELQKGLMMVPDKCQGYVSTILNLKEESLEEAETLDVLPEEKQEEKQVEKEEEEL